MMYYKLIVFYFIFASTNVRAQFEQDNRKVCERLFDRRHYEIYCCQSMGMLEGIVKKQGRTECKLKDGEKWSCNTSMCFLEKAELMVDGKVIEKNISALLDRAETPQNKNMIDRIRAKCLKGQYNDYPISICEPIRVTTCIYVNALMECTSWLNDDDECKAVSSSAAECKAQVDGTKPTNRSAK